MTPTLNREMARFTAGAHSPQSIRDLLRNLEFICFGLAGVTALAVWGASGYIANSWVKNKLLANETVANAFAIFAIVFALRFCESIYRSSLFGLQRQVWFNAVNAALATIRHGGAACLLIWFSPTLNTFFIWQATISLTTVFVLSLKVYSILPQSQHAAKFSKEALVGIWKFASGMLSITVLTLLLTQVDKLLLVRLLTLETFGYYTLAATVAGILTMIISPIEQSIYPRMVELSTLKDKTGLVALYHQSAQLITVLMIPPVMLLGFFAQGIVFMWSGDVHLAIHTAPIISILVLGTFLNGLMHMPYLLQLAHGWTGLTVKINFIAVLILVPALFWVVPRFGAVGAAWVWVILNLGYILIGIQLMHCKLIPNEKWRWYIADLGLPIAASVGIILMASLFRPNECESRFQWLIFLILTGGITLTFSSLFANHLRNKILNMMQLFRIISKLRI